MNVSNGSNFPKQLKNDKDSKQISRKTVNDWKKNSHQKIPNFFQTENGKVSFRSGTRLFDLRVQIQSEEPESWRKITVFNKTMLDKIQWTNIWFYEG